MIQFAKTIYKHANREFIRFFVVGVTAFAVDFLILITLTYTIAGNWILRFPYQTPLLSGEIEIYLANVIAVLVGALTTFLLNRVWSFKATKGLVHWQLARFVLVFSLTMVGNNVLYGYFLSNLGWSPAIAKVVVTAIQIGWSYLAYKHVVYRQRGLPHNTELNKATSV